MTTLTSLQKKAIAEIDHSIYRALGIRRTGIGPCVELVKHYADFEHAFISRDELAAAIPTLPPDEHRQDVPHKHRNRPQHGHSIRKFTK